MTRPSDNLPIYFRATGPAPKEPDSFWLVIVTPRGGAIRQQEVTPYPDNRKTARHIAYVNRKLGHSAYVVKRHEWYEAEDGA